MSKEATLRATITAVDKVSGPLAKMNKSIARLGASFDGVKIASRGLRDAVLPLAAIAAAAGAFSVRAVSGFLETAGALKDMSERLGVNAEALQEWQYVAEKSGVNAETMQGSMEKLNKAIFAAGSGKGDAAALFKKMGISVKDANGKLKTSADIMPQLADAFEKNKNATLRTAMAQTLMGKSGSAMIGVLSQGSASIKEQQEEARKLGLVLSNADVAAGDAFGDEKAGRLNSQIKALQLTIGSKLVPILEPLAKKMSAWLGANHEKVADGIAKAAAALGDALGKIDWDNFGRGMKLVFGVAVLAQISQIAAAVALCSKAYGGLALSILATGKAGVLSAFEGFAALTGKMIASNAAGVALTGTMLRLAAAIGGPLFAAWAGWKLGGLINDNVINPTVSALSGQKDATLGTWLYDKLHPENASMPSNTPALMRRGAAPSLLAANGGQKLQGSADINIKLDGLPQGSRVDMGNKQIPGIGLNLDAGYRSMALGGA